MSQRILLRLFDDPGVAGAIDPCHRLHLHPAHHPHHPRTPQAQSRVVHQQGFLSFEGEVTYIVHLDDHQYWDTVGAVSCYIRLQLSDQLFQLCNNEVYLSLNICGFRVLCIFHLSSALSSYMVRSLDP
jgi:hypothetical protein